MSGQPPRDHHLIQELHRILGPQGLLTDSAARLIYSHDASHIEGGLPLAVALPGTGEQVSQVVAVCAAAKVPVVGRGTGTGLSGGAVPFADSVVLGFSRLRALEQVDDGHSRVGCQPGVLNTQVTDHATPLGLHFAPDPSSQAAASVGGNIAENAGGPHCLRYGVTRQHTLGVDWCDRQGRNLTSGRHLAAERGFHLTSLLCGSEGTLGLVTRSTLNLVPNSHHTVTLLAFFPELDRATSAVVELLGQGLLPVAVEMIDQAMLGAVEQAFAFGFPTDVEAAMICEFAGQEEAVEEDSQRAREMLLQGGAREVRLAVELSERLELWKCRKKAFGAVGRLAPSYVTMDVVVPLGQLPELVQEIQVIKAKHGVEIATAFHAGDGNLHPGVHYDNRDAEETRRAHAAADEIIQAGLRRGGSCTGEHGVGLEKLHALPWQIDAQSARLQKDIKQLFDPQNILNPGKALPADDAEYAEVKPLPAEVEFAWSSLTVTAPAGISLASIQAQALERGLWIPVGSGSEATVADIFNHQLTGPAWLAGGVCRDFLLELWAETGDGTRFHSGAPVFKNVAGYDLPGALCGSGGHYVTPLAATFQLRPIPEQALGLAFRISSDVASATKLDVLLDHLSRRPAGTAGTNVLLDRSTGQLIIMTAGRDRSWDLGQLTEDIQELFPGLELTEKKQVPFARAQDILHSSLISEWATPKSDWDCWQPLPGHLEMQPPCGDQLIWQSGPGLWWSPVGSEEALPTPGWYRDPVLRGGKLTTWKGPTDPLAAEYLCGLKRIFDPANDLGGPEWLLGVRS